MSDDVQIRPRLAVESVSDALPALLDWAGANDVELTTEVKAAWMAAWNARQSEQPAPRGGHVSAPVALRETFLDVLETQTVKGMQTYGQPVMSWNGRDAGRDAIEEWLDLGIYLTQLRLEHADLVAENAALRARLEGTTP